MEIKHVGSANNGSVRDVFNQSEVNTDSRADCFLEKSELFFTEPWELNNGFSRTIFGMKCKKKIRL